MHAGLGAKTKDNEGDADLHQTRILLQLFLQPHKLAVAPAHTGGLGCEGFTIGLKREKKNYICINFLMQSKLEEKQQIRISVKIVGLKEKN